jgi:hypothetical protein
MMRAVKGEDTMRMTTLWVLGAFLFVGCGSSGTGDGGLSVTASVSPTEVGVDQPAQVACAVFDAEGNPVDTPTHVTAAEGVTVEEHSVQSSTVGSHEISCHATDHPGAAPGTTTLVVSTVAAVSVELRVLPVKEVYEIGDLVTFSWVGLNAEGTEVPDLPGSLSIPGGGAMTIEDQASHKYSLTAEGVWTVSVTLDAPLSGLTDDLTLTVDGTPPVITITHPERGSTLQGSGEAFKVTGFVSEEIGTISSFLVNDVEVSLTADGSFSTLMTPEWGLNVIMVEAVDSNGNKGKISPSFQYSSGYASFIDEDAKGLTIDDGLQIRLAQSFLDDGDHDPTKIDDMATLLEVILTNMDVETLINSALSGLAGTQPLANISGFSANLDYTIQVIPPTDVGTTFVTLQCVEGGIEVTVVIGEDGAPGLDLTLQIPATISVDAPFVGTIGTSTLAIDTGLTINKMVFSGLILLDMPQGGSLTADLENLDLELVDVQLDPIEDITVEMSLTPPFVAPITWTGNLSQLIDLNTLTDALLDPVLASATDAFITAIEPLLDDFAGDIMGIVTDIAEINVPVDIPSFLNPNSPDITLDIYTNLTFLHFTGLGAEIGMSFGTYTAKNVDRTPLGSIRREGCLIDAPELFNYDWAHELGVAIKTDSLNALLFSFWRSGALNGPIDLSSLGDSSPIPVAGLDIATEFYLAPILYECGEADGAVIQIGDLRLDLVGTLLGLNLDAVAFLDISLNAIFETKPDGFYITIGEVDDFDMEVEEMVEGTGSDAVKELLEEHLAGLIGNLLVGQSFGPIELPSVDLSESITGLPAGSVLQFQDLTVSQSSGFVLIEGELE